MVIGDSFSSDDKEEYVRSHLIPGAVMRRRCDFTIPVKIKYLVVAHVRSETAVLVVNSEIHPYVQRRASLLDCQVKLDKQSHCFLDHDSYIACREAYYLDTADLLAELQDDIASIKGMLSPDVRSAVTKAIESSFTMPREQINLLLSSLISRK